MTRKPHKPAVIVALIGAAATVITAFVTEGFGILKPQPPPQETGGGASGARITATATNAPAIGVVRGNAVFNPPPITHTDKPPVASPIKTNAPFSFRKGATWYPGVQVGLEFTVTNPNDWEVRIAGIIIEVIAIKEDSVDTSVTARAAFSRQYECKLSPQPGIYHAVKSQGQNFDFINLLKGELETFRVLLTTDAPHVGGGKERFYTLRVRVQFNVGDITGELPVDSDVIVVL
jgi:hypothetical protein